MPGKPLPALRKPFAFLACSGLDAKRVVVAGVIILAEMPLVWGAPIGGAGEITAGTCWDCWAGGTPGAIWADPIDHPPSRLKPANSATDT
ncbi:MAG: hypothetical protein ACXWWF_10225 [Nitrospira sp.]